MKSLNVNGGFRHIAEPATLTETLNAFGISGDDYLRTREAVLKRTQLEPVLLTTTEVADLLRITVRHVQNLAARRVLKPIRLGRSVRYLRRSVIEALEKMERG